MKGVNSDNLLIGEGVVQKIISMDVLTPSNVDVELKIEVVVKIQRRSIIASPKQHPQQVRQMKSQFHRQGP